MFSTCTFGELRNDLIQHWFFWSSATCKSWILSVVTSDNKITSRYSSTFILLPNACNCSLTALPGCLIDISNIMHTEHNSLFSPKEILKFRKLFQPESWTLIIYFPPLFIPIQSISRYCGLYSQNVPQI